VNIPKDPSNPISGSSPSIHSLIDYEAFCNIDTAKGIQEISVHELKQLIESNHALHLIDVREPMEYEAGHLIAKNLPLSTIQKYIDDIPAEGTVVFYCKSGRRSADAIKKLTSHSNKNSFLNLKGGILAWKEAFNSDLEVK
jgi:adenylyltransferase/sulfurtransferase